MEQAGFRPGRNCTDQIAALTTYIEKGFQNKKKTTAVLIDLTAAYDTVWREGLLFKLLKTIKCLTFYKLLNEMLTNRSFTVNIGASRSSTKQLNNGLPQGSVLAPTLFNLYISDLPATTSRQFTYADDIAISTQHEQFENNEATLNQDLEKFHKYFQQWRLKPNIQKNGDYDFPPE
ncbi:Reverse transcriptase domain [Cinara cedri]|uniref:Reverse transcriptase domain n=1 Tax=Cinara cedri TaxID=506608 RepID=A0A5E4MZM7_9HEMI|nr:Reverse transcriptase domain [Cinara cedri]